MKGRLLTLLALSAAAAAPSAHGSTFPAEGRIAFTSGGEERADIHLVHPDGSGRQALTSDGGNSDPAWSPDGRMLAFTRGSGFRPTDIWAMDADGGSVRRLTRDRRDELQPAWSPEGGRIAFVRVRRSESRPRSAIWLMNADGSGQRLITATRRLATKPVWSPDGARIAFTTIRLASDERLATDLWVVNADGTGLAMLAPNAAAGGWSPDGRRIAFERELPPPGEPCMDDACEHNSDIWVMNADGSGQVRLTTDSGRDGEPSWSPDGRRIVFSSDRFFGPGLSSELYTMAADGSCQVRLTAGAPDAFSAAWQAGAVAAQPCEQPPLAYHGPGLESARRFGRFRLLFAGESFENLALTEASRSGRDGFIFRYGDCLEASGACAAPFELQVRSVCDRHPLAYSPGLAHRRRVVRGALVVQYRDAGFADIHTGAVTVTVFAPDPSLRLVRRIAEALRPVSGDPLLGEPLPPPAFPLHMRRELRRTEAVVRRHGLARARRRLHISRSAIRDRLELARAIRGLRRPAAADRRVAARCRPDRPVRERR